MGATTEKQKDLIKQYLTESGSFDNTGTPVMQDNYFDAIVSLKELCDDLGGEVGDMHDEVTLNAADTTQETITLNDQEITVNLATTTTDGVMSAEDKTKLDNIEDGAEVNPDFKTINGESIIGVGNIVITEGGAQVQSDFNETDNLEASFIKNKPNIPSELSDLNGDLDDIADGATYVKSENNFTDVLKDKLDNILPFDPVVYYDSVTPSIITSGVDGWSVHYTNSITTGVYMISVNITTNSSSPLYIGINLGTTTKRGPIQLTRDTGATSEPKNASYTDIFFVTDLDTPVFNLMKKGSSYTINSIHIIKLS